MAAYEDLAPELSQVVDKASVVAFVENNLNEAPPPPPKTITDLSPAMQSALVQWVAWFGQEKRPAGLPAWAEWSPKRVARTLGMTEAYINGLRAERAVLVGEVQTYVGDAFKAHATILSLAYEAGDLTITGKEFLSVAAGAMGVRMVRPGGGTVERTKAAIEAGGGTFTNTSITVKAVTIPVELLSGDEFTVVADGLDSNTMVLTIASLEEPQ